MNEGEHDPQSQLSAWNDRMMLRVWEMESGAARGAEAACRLDVRWEWWNWIGVDGREGGECLLLLCEVATVREKRGGGRGPGGLGAGGWGRREGNESHPPSLNRINSRWWNFCFAMHITVYPDSAWVVGVGDLVGLSAAGAAPPHIPVKGWRGATHAVSQYLH